MRPTLYIPHYNGSERLARTLRSLRAQTRPLDVVVVDNGSSDESPDLVRDEFAEVELLELGHNHGFGAAIDRAVEEHPGDPVLVLNDDVECEPQFVEAMLETAAADVHAVAGVLVQEAAPALIDSAGVLADITLMGFDYLHGEPLATAQTAPPPLGPTGGAALYRHQPFRAVGGFDRRIFLYYEDLDLALRLRAAGAGCQLAAEARALHTYSASLGVGSGEKYAHTGWSRGYMLRRYGVLSRPGTALRALACEAAICAGQLLGDRTAKGIGGRLRGWRDAAGLARRQVETVPLLEISSREALQQRRRRRAQRGPR
jgi:N-acetylglucosaminyl-diphospho-decaprenol L-rhamnosyltransferase